MPHSHICLGYWAVQISGSSSSQKVLWDSHVLEDNVIFSEAVKKFTVQNLMLQSSLITHNPFERVIISNYTYTLQLTPIRYNLNALLSFSTVKFN